MSKPSDSKKHYPLSPSAASRWLVCAGEPALRAQCPSTSSDYAKEGTTAHWVAEECLRSGKNARDYLGVKCPETGLVIVKDMIEPVQQYVDHCRSLFGEWHAIEVRFTLPKISLDLGGTCDFASVVEDLLHVRDLKYGTGYAVDAKDNPQLLIYALGAYRHLQAQQPKLAAKIKNVVYGIVQPRLSDDNDVLKVSMLGIGDLLHWEKTVLWKAVTRTEDLNLEYVAGPHCRFCPGKAVCPEQHAEAARLAKADFAGAPLTLQDPNKITPEKLAYVLAAKDDLVSWLNAVEAHAQSLLENGTPVPGFKLVAKRANRVWADESAAATSLSAWLGADAYTPPKLISVAQAEKALKFFDQTVPDELIARPDTGNIIAPISDKRPEAKRSAIKDFTQAPMLE